jgi:glycosyltransferase involved in cell wall biosynthesis
MVSPVLIAVAPVSNMKTVVHFINCLPAIGGAERLILDLADCAKVRPVTVIAWFGKDNSLLQFDTRRSVDLISLRPLKLRELFRAIGAVRRADVVHLHLFPSLYLAPLMKKPTLFTEHNTWNGRRDHAWMRPIERWCYSYIDKVIAISPATAESLQEWLGFSPARLSVIPNGIRLDRFDRKPRKIIGDRVVIGMAARFVRQKDHGTLVRAMGILPSNYRLKLAGDGPLRKKLENLAR